MDKTIKINQTGISIDFSKPLNSKQMYNIKQWVNRGRLDRVMDYLNSFKGTKESVSVDRLISYGCDELAKKSPNSILEIFERRFSVEDSHRPTSSHTTWIGVEIECMVPYNFNNNNLQPKACSNCDGDGEIFDEDSESYNNCDECGGSGEHGGDSDIGLSYLGLFFKNNKVKYTNVKHDGSIEAKDGFFAAEVTVLTRSDDFSNLKKVCSLLNQIGAEVNKSCGMHVHLDARHLNKLDVKNIGNKFKRCLPLLLSMVPKTRRTNHFCKPRVSRLDGDRYAAVNLTAYRKYKTIEIRLHSSTTDFNKIQHWVTLLNSIASATKLPKVIESLDVLTDYVYLPEETLEHCAQRIALFNDQVCKQEFKDNDNTTEVIQPIVNNSFVVSDVSNTTGTVTLTRIGA